MIEGHDAVKYGVILMGNIEKRKEKKVEDIQDSFYYRASCNGKNPVLN